MTEPTTTPEPTTDDMFPGGDMLSLDCQICFPLYAASNMLTRLYRPALAAIGLTYPQYLVMLVLWERSPASVGELGARLYLDSGTLTPLLKRLESAGLITRTRDRDDERRVNVALTPAGIDLRNRASSVPLSVGEGLDVSIEDLLVVRRSVRNLVDALGKIDPRG